MTKLNKEETLSAELAKPLIDSYKIIQKFPVPIKLLLIPCAVGLLCGLLTDKEIKSRLSKIMETM